MLQGQRFCALGLAAIAAMSSLALVAQTGASNDLVANKLKEQFPITVFSRDASQVLTAGAVVTLQKDGFLVFRLPVPAHPVSTYKNGKLSQGFGDTFAACLANGLNQPNGCNDIPQKTLATGEKFWISAIVVGKKDIVLVAVTDPYDDGRYIGELKFPFGKGSVPSPDEALRMVSEVVTAQPAQNQSAQPSAVQYDAGQTNSASNNGTPSEYPASVQGKYVRKGKGSDFLVLGSDGVFFVHQDGRDVRGSYKVEGDTLIATSPRVKREWRSRFVGNSLNDPDGMVWEKQADSATALAPATASFQEAPPPARALLPDIAPPPPPPDVPPPAPPTIALGQTVDQVIAGFGQPLRLAKVGTKVIYYYKDMKVTFTNGIVSDVE